MTTKHSSIDDSLMLAKIEKDVDGMVEELRNLGREELVPVLLDSMIESIQLVNAHKHAQVDLCKVREVVQWAHFESAADARRFASALNGMGAGVSASTRARTKTYIPVLVRCRSSLQLKDLGRLRFIMGMLIADHRGCHAGTEVKLDNSTARQ